MEELDVVVVLVDRIRTSGSNINLYALAVPTTPPYSLKSFRFKTLTWYHFSLSLSLPTQGLNPDEGKKGKNAQTDGPHLPGPHLGSLDM